MYPSIAPRVRIASGVTIALIATTALAGCAPPPAGTNSSIGSDATTILVGGDFDTLDPALATGISSRTIHRFIYDTVLATDKNGEVAAGLAEEWDISSTHAHLVIRDDVTCADGSPLTAETIARNFERARDPELNAPLTTAFFGPGDYTVSFDNDARTVDVELSVPSPFFEAALTVGPSIVCDAGLDDPELLSTSSQGTGPYVLTEAVQGDHYTVALRGDDYAWGPDGASTEDPAMPQEIIFQLVDDQNTQANLVLGGDANIMAAATPTIVDRFTGNDSVTTEVYGLTTTDLIFNQRKGLPGQSIEVRTALAQAIDRSELAAIETEGKGSVADSLRADFEICTDPSATGPLVASGGPSIAARTLDDAGWELNDAGVREKDGEPLTIRLLQFAMSSPSMEYVRAVWSDLGVDVQIDSRSVGEASGTLFAGTEWDATFVEVAGENPTAFSGLFGGPASPNGGNFAGIVNTVFEEKNAEARPLTGADACGPFLEGEMALIENVDVTPMFAVPLHWVFSGATAAVDSAWIIPTTLRVAD